MGNLGSVIDELSVVDLHALPGPVLGEHIVELNRAANRLHAEYLHALEVFDRSGASLASHGSTSAWVRAELHKSAGSAARDVHLARDLADILPGTDAALRDGAISGEHAQVIAGLKNAVNPDAVATAEPHLADYATRVSPKELRAAVTHVKQTYAPDKLTRDEADDYQARYLDVATTIGGMGVGKFALHAHGQETLMTAIHAASRPVAGDLRTAKQRRADALITIAELALKSGDLPVTGGVKPHVSMIIKLNSDGDDADGDGGAAGPTIAAGDCAFGATLGPEWAKRVSCDADIARIVFGPHGEVLDSGRATRTFTVAQVRAIIARDRHCIWPGCDAPAGWCDTHHILHWTDPHGGPGGNTSVTNGALLCGRHHDHTHANGHAIITTPDGRYFVDVRPGSDPHWRGHPHHHKHNRAGP